jgi:hypothetical protein
MPPRRRVEGILIYSCPSVRPSGYRYMVCPAISSYSFGATNNRGLKEIKPIFTITMLDHFPRMSVFHQERTEFVTIEQEYYAFIQEKKRYFYKICRFFKKI